MLKQNILIKNQFILKIEIKFIIIKLQIMNSFELNYRSLEDLILINKSLTFDEDADFNLEMSPEQIFSEVADLESLHTKIFDQEWRCEHGYEVSLFIW